MMRRRMRHPTAGWTLRRALSVHGVRSPPEYFRLTKDYSNQTRRENSMSEVDLRGKER
jgi:hypothetical protein